MSDQKGRLLGWFDGNRLSACLKFTESSSLNIPSQGLRVFFVPADPGPL